MNEIEVSYRVIVMGKTGSGKSSVLNALTRSEYFKVGNSIMSETKEVKSLNWKFRGDPNSPNIAFIDTPGFFDSSSKDNKIIEKIALSLHKMGDGVNVVLFCFPAYEIRLDASMQASWKFLKLIMGSAVYEHVIIVLTHGSRLTAQELEESIRRMTTEFIPYLRNALRCKVKEDILIFKKNCKDDGLDSVLNYITENKKYKPKIMKDIGKYWDPKDPTTSIESLIKNSLTFARIQGLLLEVKYKNEDLQGQLKEIRHGIKHIDKESIKKLAHSLNTKIRTGKETVETLRGEMEHQMETMQQRINEKNKQIDILWKEIYELKSKFKLCDSLTTRTTTATGKLGREHAYKEPDVREHPNERKNQYYSNKDLNNIRVPSASSKSGVNTGRSMSIENSKIENHKVLSYRNHNAHHYPTKDLGLEKKKVGKQVKNEKYYMNPAYVPNFNRAPVHNAAHYVDTKKINPPNERKGLIDVRNPQSKLKKALQGTSMKLRKEHAHCIYK